MSYGIEVKNSNGNIQFSTDVSDQLTVIDTGTVSNNSSVTYDGSNEILAMNMPSAGSQTWLIGNTNSTATSWTNSSGYTVNWLKLKRLRTQTAANQNGNDTGNYGVEVKNTSGNITFSTRFTKMIKAETILASGSTSGSITTSNCPVIYSGNLTSNTVYCAPGRMRSSLGGNPAFYYENFYFDYTANEIRFRSIYGVDIGNGYIWLPQANQSTVIVFTRT